MTTEHHATRARDWMTYGNNLGQEAFHTGGGFNDARRLMLAAWEGWTSGEPGQDRMHHEFLATVWAMIQLADGMDIKAAVVELIKRASEEVGDE